MEEIGSFKRIQIRMASERIHILKFILEGYDNLAMQSTVDSAQGLVELKYPAMLESEVLDLVQGLPASLGVQAVGEAG